MARRAQPQPERAARRQIQPVPLTMLERAGLEAGDRVVDIGCGPEGCYARAAAKVVGPAGCVLAVDVEPEAVGALSRRKLARQLRLEVCAPDQLPAADESHDLAVMAHTLHEVREIGGFLGEVNRVLKPGGRVMVVDWRKVDDGWPPAKKSRIARGDTQAILERAGFEVETAEFLDPSNYLVLATKVATVLEVDLGGDR